MVVIIDYEMGNKQSVMNAFESLGASVAISNKPEVIRQATQLVLPGVGAFGDGMKKLQASGLVSLLTEEVLARKKPFLGICLGMQLLATAGTEHGHHQGLGWIPGLVDPIPIRAELRIPHVGWNSVRVQKNSPLLEGLETEPNFYFLHSYYFQPEMKDDIAATCHYSLEFAAVLQRENIFATQFHPEKSQKDGLKLLENFLKYHPC